MSQTPVNNVTTDDEIDLKQVVGALKRRRGWLTVGAIAGGLAASVVTVISKPVWEGKFQIVVSQNENGVGGNLALQGLTNSVLSNIGGIGGIGSFGRVSELETEVKILESPSVLRPVFEFVRTSKERSGRDVSKLRFTDWIDNSVRIELEKGTSVLSISYRDTDESLVLPVMQQISEAYQQYSGRERSESIRNGLIYAKEQVAHFRQQAAKSNRALDAFSIRYGIASTGAPFTNAGIDVSKVLGSNKTSGFMSSGGSVLKRGDALSQLASINQELIRRQQQFTDRDPGVQALIRERDALRHYIELTAGGSLALPGQLPTSKEEAQELSLEFQELQRTAKRDTATLDLLEGTLLSLELEQARSSKPWELISKPTLLEKPISPRPSRNIALGLLVGLAAGSGVALLVDRHSDRVYTENELLQLLPGPLLANLDDQVMQSKLSLLAKGALAGSHQVAVIPVGLQGNSSRIQSILSQLKQNLPHTSFSCSRDLVDAASCDHQLLITSLGSPKRSELKSLQQQLALQGRPITGWLLLEENNKHVG